MHAYAYAVSLSQISDPCVSETDGVLFVPEVYSSPPALCMSDSLSSDHRILRNRTMRQPLSPLYTSCYRF